MWKRKSTVTVTEASLPPPPIKHVRKTIKTADHRRVYKLKQVPKLRQFSIQDQSTKTVLYTLTVTPLSEWDIFLSEGTPDDAKRDNVLIYAAAQTFQFDRATKCTIGNPKLKPDISQHLEIKEEATFPTMTQGISLPLPYPPADGPPVLDLVWKNSNKSKGFRNKMDRGMHHKLVDRSTNQTLAHYTHRPLVDDITGDIEIFARVEGIPVSQWEHFVLISALSVAQRKIVWVHKQLGLPVREVTKEQVATATADAAVTITEAAMAAEQAAQGIEAAFAFG